MELGDPNASDPSAIGWLLSSDLVFGKNDLRPGRIVALLGVATTIFTLVTIFWVPVRRALGWLLMPLGQRALGAYGLHLFIVAAAHSWIGDPLARIGSLHLLARSAALRRGAHAHPGRRHPPHLGGAPAVAMARERRAPRDAGITVASSRALSPHAATDSRSGVKRRALLASAFAVGVGCTVPATRPAPTLSASPPATPSPTASPSSAPDIIGSVSRIEDRKFASRTLGREMPYFAFLPPGYDANATVSYPVLYMLHGMSGTNTEWIDLGLFTQADAQCLDPAGLTGKSLGNQETDPRNLRLLSQRRKRCRERAKTKREYPSAVDHSTTS